VQVAGLGFLFVPINMTAYVGMPQEKTNSVAGLINFMRNMGSSVGTSMVTTLIARRSQVHQEYLVAHLSPGSRVFEGSRTAIVSRLSTVGSDHLRAAQQAIAISYRSLVQQATLLAYIDTYTVLATLGAIMFALSFFLRKNQPGSRPVALE
jgi:DHA2 family multidrug resistance protein